MGTGDNSPTHERYRQWVLGYHDDNRTAALRASRTTMAHSDREPLLSVETLSIGRVE